MSAIDGLGSTRTDPTPVEENGGDSEPAAPGEVGPTVAPLPLPSPGRVPSGGFATSALVARLGGAEAGFETLKEDGTRAGLHRFESAMLRDVRLTADGVTGHVPYHSGTEASKVLKSALRALGHLVPAGEGDGTDTEVWQALSEFKRSRGPHYDGILDLCTATELDLALKDLEARTPADGAGASRPGSPSFLSETFQKSPALSAFLAGTGPLDPSAIHVVQEALAHFGYLAKSKVGSPYGPETRGALLEFQHELGVPESGEIDVPTLRELDAWNRIPRWLNNKLDLDLLTPRGANRLFFERTGGITGADVEFDELARWVGGASETTVAVVDYPFKLDHPLFADNRPANPVEPRDRPSGSTGHGYAVAGIAAYGTDRIKIRPVRFSLDETAVSDYMSEACASGARVVNMSFRVARVHGERAAEEMRRIVESNPDIFFVQAAGNDGDDLDLDTRSACPGLDGREKNAILVGMGGRDGKFSGFSSYSPTRVGIATAGSAVSASFDGDYAGNVGTSISAPVVSNIAAKLFSLCPTLTAADVKTILMSSATPAFRSSVASGVADPVTAYRAAAVVARVRGGEPIAKILAELPGRMNEAERRNVKRVARRVLGGDLGNTTPPARPPEP